MNLYYLKNVVTLKINSNKCTGCHMCINVCPHAVFEMNDGKAVIKDKDACMECGACKRNCAFGAIYVREGVGCAGAILTSKGDPEKATCDCSGSSPSCCG